MVEHDCPLLVFVISLQLDQFHIDIEFLFPDGTKGSFLKVSLIIEVL